jgi:Flp pilus assembly protein TadD
MVSPRFPINPLEVAALARIILCVLLVSLTALPAALAGLPAGHRPPPFKLLSLDGDIVTRKDLRGNPGAVVFWSVSDPMSHRVLNDFKSLYERYGKEEFTVLAVHTGDHDLTAAEIERMNAYAGNEGVPFPILMDWNGRARHSFQIGDVPSTVVVDSFGHTAYTLDGYSLEKRQELAASLFETMGRDRSTGRLVAVRSERDLMRDAGEKRENPATACTIPRALYCTLTAERGSPSSDPSIMAVRLSVCRGDSEGARSMLRGVAKTKYVNNDLRFALGNMLLLKGSFDEAEKAFSSLRDDAPGEGWGSWGLGMSDLLAGNAAAAVLHMQEGASLSPNNPEAETAVLKYLEEYWSADRRAPLEERFLDLFAELASVRDCYRQTSGRG